MNSLKCLLIHCLWMIQVYNIFSMKSYLGADKEKIFYEGQREKDDRMDLNITVRAYKSQDERKIKEIRYPTTRPWGHKITYIEAVDIAKCGGSVSLIEGGVGFYRAKLRFKSAENKGLKYEVKIYTMGPTKYTPPGQEPVDDIEVPDFSFAFE